jgi:signal transduction histidine kinase
VIGALHDDVGQPLYRVLYGLEGCLERTTSTELTAELQRLDDLVRGIDRSLRSELRILHAGLVEGEDLYEALERLADATSRESGIETTVTGSSVPGLSSTAATALFRGAQEAVINARKHARPHSVTIDLRPHRGGAMVEIVDDGRGWNGKEGMGITTTRQRLAALDGNLDVARNLARGTVVRAWVPTADRMNRGA